MKADSKKKRKQSGVRGAAPAHTPPRASWTWADLGQWLKGLLPAVLLVVLVVVTYAPTLNNTYIWDDDSYVTQNLNLRTPAGLWNTWFNPLTLPQFYPLVHTTFWCEYQAWGLRPLGYHIDNMLLHAVGVLLAWRVLLRLNVPCAWLGAALFAVHPVMVESVAWVTERKNVLSMALALASMLCYLRFAPPEADPAEQPTGRGRYGFYLLALVLFLGALLSKTVVASLPAVLLLIYWWKRGRLGGRYVVPLLPFFAVGVSLGLVTAWLERIHVGAEGDEWAFTPVDRVLIAGRAVWFYATKLAWPHPIIFFYPRWEIDSSAPWQYLFPLAALMALAGLFLARSRIGRGPLVAALIFCGVLMPALGFLNVYPFRYSFVADHFQHHASLALFALAAAGVGMLDDHLSRGGQMPFPADDEAIAQPALSTQRIILRGVIAVTLMALSAISFRQTFTYYDLDSLYLNIIAKNPGCWAAYSNLGAHMMKTKRVGEGEELLREAIKIAPKNYLAHSNYGHALLQKGQRDGFAAGQIDEAIEHFATAMQIEPRFTPAYVGMAMALSYDGRNSEAKDYLAQALERRAEYPEALTAMGVLLVKEEDWSGAKDYFERALHLKSNLVAAQHGLGLALDNLGKPQEAISHLQIALQLDPDSFEAHYVLGNALYKLRDLHTAADQYREALRIKPEYLDALSNLGVVLGMLGDADGAVDCFERIVKIDPDFNGAQSNLAKAREMKKKPQAAAPQP